MDGKLIHVENIVLPNGGIYEGDAYEMPFGGVITLCGKGEVVNPDGSKYKGDFKDNHPCGFGIHTFRDGDYHVGFFDDMPNGPGYLCLNTENGMMISQYRDGKKHGWSIGIRHGIFNCSYLQYGNVVKDYTSEFGWMHDYLQNNIFIAYKGNMVQTKADIGFIRYGAPNRTANAGGYKYSKHAIGYAFLLDGTMLVGLFPDVKNLNGWGAKCLPDGTFQSGHWVNNQLEKSLDPGYLEFAIEAENRYASVNNRIQE